MRWTVAVAVVVVEVLSRPSLWGCVWRALFARCVYPSTAAGSGWLPSLAPHSLSFVHILLDPLLFAAPRVFQITSLVFVFSASCRSYLALFFWL